MFNPSKRQIHEQTLVWDLIREPSIPPFACYSLSAVPVPEDRLRINHVRFSLLFYNACKNP